MLFRVRFKTSSDDYRPITWPIKYPYWCSGYDKDGNSVLIAYVDSIEDIYKLWPEAKDLDYTEENEIIFSSRFQKPDWFIQ
jgi:hypothetical protein